MIVKSRRIRKPISAVLMLVLMLSVFCFGNYFNNTEAEAANNFIISGDYYYIKNVNSGKYLTTEHYSSDEGTRIVQWNFTGQTNQMWEITRIATGTYSGYFKIATALNTSRVIEIEQAQTQSVQ